MAALPLWTIGHSNHSFETVAGLLASERIAVVVDVRSHPYSKVAPQFNREQLQPSLRARGVQYLFLGEELGGRPGKAEHYDATGHALYARMASEPAFKRAIDRLLRGAETHRIALLCSERDPAGCHRRLLVGKVLVERGAELHHVLADGSVEVERVVSVGATQGSLLGEDSESWRSTRSVSRRRRLSTSSGG